jgi:hypothetical protein
VMVMMMKLLETAPSVEVSTVALRLLAAASTDVCYRRENSHTCV